MPEDNGADSERKGSSHTGLDAQQDSASSVSLKPIEETVTPSSKQDQRKEALARADEKYRTLRGRWLSGIATMMTESIAAFSRVLNAYGDTQYGNTYKAICAGDLAMFQEEFAKSGGELVIFGNAACLLSARDIGEWIFAQLGYYKEENTLSPEAALDVIAYIAGSGDEDWLFSFCERTGQKEPFPREVDRYTGMIKVEEMLHDAKRFALWEAERNQPGS